MRHQKAKKTLNRPANHRRSLKKNLALSFFEHEKIETTVAKAKYIKPIIEKIITVGKKDNLTAKRYIIKKISSNKIATKIIKEISPKYKDRQGGYTRITKIGNRKGDGSETVYLTLV